MHFFGYRFRIGLKGEYAFGDICWGRFSPEVDLANSTVRTEAALGRRLRCAGITPKVQAIFFRRRHGRRPPFAKIRVARPM